MTPRTPEQLAFVATALVEARSWLGTPFVLGASVKGVGVDCVQFGRAVGMALDILPTDFPDFLPYPAGWLLERNDTRYRDELAKSMCLIWERQPGISVRPPNDLVLPGDLLLFRVGRAPAHSAIVTAWPMVVHAWDEEQVVEESAMMNTLRARPLLSVWRAPRLLSGGAV